MAPRGVLAATLLLAALSLGVWANDCDDFHQTAAQGDIAKLKRMLERGVDINCKNEDGNTALHQATLQGLYEVVEFLLDRGIDDSITGRHGAMGGYSALHHASSFGYIEVVKSLLKKGASSRQLMDSPTTDTKSTCLHLAARHGNVQVAKLLLDASANRDAVDGQQMTALEIAYKSGMDDMVDALVSRGALLRGGVDKWSAPEVGVWLRTIKMTKYQDNFRKHEITGTVLLDLDSINLDQMGVSNVVDHIKIRRALAKLRKGEH